MALKPGIDGPSDAHTGELKEALGRTDDGELSARKATAKATARRSTSRLPRELKRFFWEYDFAVLSWEEDRDLVILRILSVGDWQSIQWLLQRLGHDELRGWLEQRRGRGLEPRQLRFWEVVLGIPHRTVNAWIAAGDPAWLGRLVG